MCIGIFPCFTQKQRGGDPASAFGVVCCILCKRIIPSAPIKDGNDHIWVYDLRKNMWGCDEKSTYVKLFLSHSAVESLNAGFDEIDSWFNK